MNRVLFFFLSFIFSSSVNAQEVELSRRFHGKDAPVIIYSSLNKKYFIAVTDTISNVNPDSLRYYLETMRKGLESFSGKGKMEVNSKIETINGIDVAYLENVYQKDDFQIYDLKFFTKVSNSLILFNLHFEDNKIDDWKIVAKRIFYSLKIKESSK